MNHISSRHFLKHFMSINKMPALGIEGDEHVVLKDIVMALKLGVNDVGMD